jgi:nucleotidyltransferase substrate binding protein (TIGR01987 family)
MNKFSTQNFENTLAELKSYLAIPIANNRDKAGIIQAFEFTYEQSWLAIQKAMGTLSVSVPTPKQAFIAAMKQGWILQAEEDLWLQMIEDRNRTSHTYQQQLAEEVLRRIQSNYVRIFENLLSKLKSI